MFRKENTCGEDGRQNLFLVLHPFLPERLLESSRVETHKKIGVGSGGTCAWTSAVP